VPYNRVWETTTDDPAHKSANIIDEDSSKVSILFSIPYSCPIIKHEQLFNTLLKGIETNFKEMGIVIIGRIPPEVEDFASKAPWEQSDGGQCS